MGIFNTLIINCPECGEEVHEQIKPGEMNTFVFGKDPKTDMLFEGVYFCNGCTAAFEVAMETLPKMVVKKYDYTD